MFQLSPRAEYTPLEVGKQSYLLNGQKELYYNLDIGLSQRVLTKPCRQGHMLKESSSPKIFKGTKVNIIFQNPIVPTSPKGKAPKNDKTEQLNKLERRSYSVKQSLKSSNLNTPKYIKYLNIQQSQSPLGFSIFNLNQQQQEKTLYNKILQQKAQCLQRVCDNIRKHQDIFRRPQTRGVLRNINQSPNKLYWRNEINQQIIAQKYRKFTRQEDSNTNIKNTTSQTSQRKIKTLYSAIRKNNVAQVKESIFSGFEVKGWDFKDEDFDVSYLP